MRRILADIKDRLSGLHSASGDSPPLSRGNSYVNLGPGGNNVGGGYGGGVVPPRASPVTTSASLGVDGLTTPFQSLSNVAILAANANSGTAGHSLPQRVKM